MSGGSTSPSTAHVNPTSGSPGTPSTPPPKGPACAQTGHHSPINTTTAPRLRRRQWARSSPQHARKKDMPYPPPRRKRFTANRRAQTVVHYTPHTPCRPDFTEVDCTLSKHSGGFATIDHRHAGDTPQSSAYGSNSPQATNKDDAHHPDKWTRMSNTTHATTPPQTSATASPTETPQTPHVARISPRWTAL